MIPNLNVSPVDIECQCCEIVLANQKNILFMNIYRPPQGNVDTFVKSVDQALEIIDTKKNDIIMMGDFNIDFLDKSNNDTKSMNRLVSENGLIKLINAPNKNSCIDQIITNSKLILEAGINISDHQLIYFIKKKQKDIPTKTTFEGRLYRNYDCDYYLKGLMNMIGIGFILRLILIFYGILC